METCVGYAAFSTAGDMAAVESKATEAARMVTTDVRNDDGMEAMALAAKGRRAPATSRKHAEMDT